MIIFGIAQDTLVQIASYEYENMVEVSLVFVSYILVLSKSMLSVIWLQPPTYKTIWPLRKKRDYIITKKETDVGWLCYVDLKIIQYLHLINDNTDLWLAQMSHCKALEILFLHLLNFKCVIHKLYINLDTILVPLFLIAPLWIKLYRNSSYIIVIFIEISMGFCKTELI